MRKLIIFLLFCGCSQHHSSATFVKTSKIVREKYVPSNAENALVISEDDCYCRPEDHDFLKIRVGKEYTTIWYTK
jgi:hypothetical protein